jgi:outer membrane lipoprotein-sorting protein
MPRLCRVDSRLIPTVLCTATIAALILGQTSAISPLAPASAHAEERAKPLGDIAKLTTTLADLQATIRVTKYDSAELEKIGSDFKTTYSLRNLTFQYKQPDKIRIEARSQTRGDAILILNGAMRYYEVPKLKLRKSENLETHPGKRQSLLEYAGLVSPGTLQFMDGKLLREEKVGDHDTVLYEMHFQGEEKNSFYRIWIDKQTRVTVKREWCDSGGKLRATFLYTDPQEIAPGIWLPTKVEVKNAEGISAAVLSMSDIKPNQGLSDAPFSMEP